MDLSVDFLRDGIWSYAYAGTRRPLIREIIVELGQRLPQSDVDVFPRLRLDFPFPELVAPVWEGNRRTLESRGQHVGEPISWTRVDLKLNYPLLARLQERVEGRVIVEVVNAANDEVLAECTKELTLLAPNQWQFEAEYHEILAAFVFPNDPYTQEILSKARELLQKDTGDSSTEGYQSEEAPSPNDQRPLRERSRAHKIANAIYDAMSSMGYAYSNPQNLFDLGAQRVRTPAQIRQENCATCLDSSVLMAACFAQAGLEPVLFLTKGHAFAGYFTGAPLTNSAGQMIVGPDRRPVVGDAAVRWWLNSIGKSILRRKDDYGTIQHLLRGGHLQPVETTSTTSGGWRPFNEACLRQNNFSIQDDALLESIVLVSSAWRQGITPPVALLDVPLHGFHPTDETQEDETSSPSAVSSFEFDIDADYDDLPSNGQGPSAPPRVRQWMASLLDLSSRNPLLKVKPNQLLEFIVPPKLLGSVDDLLYTPKKRIEVVSPAALPFEWLTQGVDEGKFESWMGQQVRLVSPPYTELNGVQREIDSLLKAYRGKQGDPIPRVPDATRRDIEDARANPSHPIHRVSDADFIRKFRDNVQVSWNAKLAASVSKVQTKAKDVMLATGNNSLYLAIGTMAWTESGESRGTRRSVDWCAPLYLHPVILEGGKGSPFTVRLDLNGEATPNYCLHEKLKRPPYNLDLQELVNPMYDEKGLDFNAMVSAIERRLKQAKLDNFAIQPRVLLGVFDYSTFRLWKDYKDSWREMSELSPSARHLMITPNVPFTADPPIPEPRLETYLPIAADDSQREAVQWALDGRSFRLEGPPGTGKSQTITNLLASCIANNKKVLFVAEKQTALNAVKERLDECGLGNFCLNLHAKGDSDTRLRKNISEALTTALQQSIDPQHQKWQDLEFRIRNEEEILNRYRDSLHQSPAGQPSVWQANEELIEIGDGPSLDVPSSFVENFGQRWPEFQRIASRIDQALELTGNPGSNPWRIFVGTSAAENEFFRISEALDAVVTAHQALHQRGEEWSTLFESMDANASLALADAVSLRAEGSLQDFEVARQLAAKAHSVDSTPDSDEPLRVFLRRCDELRGQIAPHLDALSPELMDAGLDEAVNAVLVEIENLSTSAAFGALSEAWTELAARVRNIRSELVDGLLSRDDLHLVVDALAEYDAQTVRRDLDDLIADARAFEAKVRGHLVNISGTLLARNDLLNLRLLQQDASAAGFLKRAGKIKLLRDALGPDALASDDRFLLQSLAEMLRLAESAEDLCRRLQIQFPDLYSSTFRPWVADDIEALRTAFQRQRFEKLQRAVEVPVGPDIEDRFVHSVRLILGFADRVAVCHHLLSSVSPALSAQAYRPWRDGELDRLRSELLDGKLRRLREVVGSSSLTQDDERLLGAVRSFVSARAALEELRSVARTDLAPTVDSRFRPWDPDDVSSLTTLRARFLRVGRLLADERWWALVKKVLEGEVRPEDAQLLPAASAAWRLLDDVLATSPEGRTEWLAGRSLSAAVLESFPELRRDGGDRHGYVKLRRWLELLGSLDELDTVGLSALRPLFLEDRASVEEIVSQVRRSSIQSALETRLQAGNLDRFDRKMHERRIRTFEKALADAKSLLKVRIPGLMSERRISRALPTGSNLGATQALLKGLKPVRGEKTPIRDLISRYGTALAEAMPCFLMSPDSVATLIPVGSITFDVVIFDEASQVRTSHAVGALGRGKAGIVVGDSRQMPPATTFSSNSGAYVEDDDLDDDPVEQEEDVDLLDPSELTSAARLPLGEAARDAESILSEYYDSNFPHLQLLCHYRSKDEVLIAFSNTHIYETPMLTFPSVRGLESTALRFLHVPTGFFQRDKAAPPFRFKTSPTALPALRTNREEAEAVVDEVLARLRDPLRQQRREADPEQKAESIIVVTFNIQQMKLIDALLKEADADLYEKAVTEGDPDEATGKRTPPRLKIRNLENVQGDEAETVIFSVAFTKTLAGTFPLNWGPVTQPGGERRLNVAVTRAQREMIVFASFLPQDMSGGNKVLSEMALMVQRFLTLAYRGPGRVGDVGIEVVRSRHIEAIAQEPRNRGYIAHTQLGLSNLRVDIAVKRPESSEWELAIMIDDLGWFGRGSAFQREVLPRQVLPGLGWKQVHRVWLPSWLSERDEVLDEIEVILHSTQQAPEEDSTMIDPPQTLPAPQLPPPSGAQRVVQSGRPRLALNTSKPASEPAKSPEAFTPFTPFVPFEVTVLGTLGDLNGANVRSASRERILRIIDQVISAEGPVELRRLAKLVAGSLGIGTVTEQRVQQILSLVPKERVHEDIIGSFAWPSGVNRETWLSYRTSVGDSPRARTAKEISAFEYRNALIDLVTRVHSVGQAEALREVGQVFGFDRLKEPTRGTISGALAWVVDQGWVLLVDGEYHPQAPS